MNMKKMLSVLVGTSMLVSMLAACGGDTTTSTPSDSSNDTSTPAETIVLKLGHNSNAESMYNQGCEKFAELVTEYTNGTVEIEIHTSGT